MSSYFKSNFCAILYIHSKWAAANLYVPPSTVPFVDTNLELSSSSSVFSNFLFFELKITPISFAKISLLSLAASNVVEFITF